MPNFLSRSLANAMSALCGQKKDDCIIKIHPDGVNLEWVSKNGELGKRNLKWSGITSVTVYKRDLITYDLICLSCICSDGFQFEFNEEMLSWQSLVDAFSQHLPGFPSISDWWSPVATPAFSTNERTLFRRESDVAKPQ